MTPGNEALIRRAAQDLQAALNSARGSRFEIIHTVTSHQGLISARTEYQNEIRVIATTEQQVYP